MGTVTANSHHFPLGSPHSIVKGWCINNISPSDVSSIKLLTTSVVGKTADFFKKTHLEVDRTQFLTNWAFLVRILVEKPLRLLSLMIIFGRQ
jgi:hypothetical protein